MPCELGVASATPKRGRSGRRAGGGGQREGATWGRGAASSDDGNSQHSPSLFRLFRWSRVPGTCYVIISYYYTVCVCYYINLYYMMPYYTILYYIMLCHMILSGFSLFSATLAFVLVFRTAEVERRPGPTEKKLTTTIKHRNIGQSTNTHQITRTKGRNNKTTMIIYHTYKYTRDDPGPQRAATP